jgi:predicted DCC family thiol-disulfide oxidoreductase YuxK
MLALSDADTVPFTLNVPVDEPVTANMTGDRLFYDDSCPICRRAVKRLRRKGLDSTVKLVPLSRLNDIDTSGLPDKQAMQKEIHLITADGKVFRGASALTHLYKRQGRGRLLNWLYELPPVRWIADAVYRLIARNRHWLSQKLGWG